MTKPDGMVCPACERGKHDDCRDFCGCIPHSTICTCEVCWPKLYPSDDELEDMKRSATR